MVKRDEIDLEQIFLSLWGNKLRIFFITILFALGSLVLTFNLDKKFEATAIFALENSAASEHFNSSLSGLSILSGMSLSGIASQQTQIFDRVTARDFALKLNRKANFENDPFFNPPKSDKISNVEHVKNFIKYLVRFDRAQDPEFSDQLQISEKIFKAYLKSVNVQETPNGSIQIDVEHPDPTRAAFIANELVNQIDEELKFEDKKNRKDQLAFLSNELAKSLEELENSKRKVSYFSLSNGLGSPAEFVERAQSMDEFRDQLKITNDMLQGIKALTDLINKLKDPSPQDYLELRAKRPVIDRIEFRRLLGVPEALNSWEAPSVDKLKNISNILEDRLARIKSYLAEMRVEAERDAILAKRLEELQREEAIASATYQVMTEQIKTYSLQSGFEKKRLKIYQTAAPPTLPSNIDHKVVLALGTFMGALISCAIALLVTFRKGTLFSQHSIAKALSNPITIPSKIPSKVRGNISKILKKYRSLDTSSFIDLEFGVRENPKKPILITPLGMGISALPFTLKLAQLNSTIRQHNSPTSTAIILLEQDDTKGLDFRPINHSEIQSATYDDITFYAPKTEQSIPSILTDSYFTTLITQQNLQKHDRIVIVTPLLGLAIAANVLREYDPITIAVTSPGKTTMEATTVARRIIKWSFNVSLKN